MLYFRKEFTLTGQKTTIDAIAMVNRITKANGMITVNIT